MMVAVGQSHWAEIDEADAVLVLAFKWYPSVSKTARTSRVYAVTTDRSGDRPKTIYMHRLILAPAMGLFVDHIDSNGLNNKRSNLRECTNAQNMANSRWPTGASGFRGVQFYAPRRTWKARMSVDGRSKTIGYAKTPEEAARLYDAAVKARFGAFAITNFKDV